MMTDVCLRWPLCSETGPRWGFGGDQQLGEEGKGSISRTGTNQGIGATRCEFRKGDCGYM